MQLQALAPLLLLLPLTSALLCIPNAGSLLGDFNQPDDYTFVLEARQQNGSLYPLVISAKDNRTLELGAMSTGPGDASVPLFHISAGTVKTADGGAVLATQHSALTASQPLVLGKGDGSDGAVTETFSLFKSSCDGILYTVLRYTDLLPVLALGSGVVLGEFGEGAVVQSPVLANLITPLNGTAVDLIMFSYP